MDKADIVSRLRAVSVRKLEVAGMELYVRGLSGADRARVVLALSEAQAKKDSSLLPSDHQIAAMGLCASDGTKLFESAEETADLDGDALGKIATAILEASGLRPDSEAQAEGN